MTSRRKWTLIPAFFAIATAATLLSAYSGASSSQGFSPVQPIKFPHPVHVQNAGDELPLLPLQREQVA